MEHVYIGYAQFRLMFVYNYPWARGKRKKIGRVE